jgi:hypothetical protein
MHLHKNRLWGISGDRRTLWHTKDYSENPGVAPGWHANFTLNFDESLVGLVTLDDKLIVFSETSIWYITGDGPSASGAGSDYSPNKVQTDVGCSLARSIVSEPHGIMFVSPRGLYRLTRSLELEWIGKPVRDSLAAFPVVTSGVLVHALSQIRFTCNSPDGLSGIVLVYSYTRDQWSRFEYTDGATAMTPIADAILVGETWTFVTPGGIVYREDSTTYLDGGSHWVTMDVETAEIFAEGPLSYQRVRQAYLLGSRLTDCDLTLSVAVNGLSTYDQARLWRSSQVKVIGSAKVGIHVKTQLNSSFRIRITDSTPSDVGAIVGTGQGVTLSALGFEIAPQVGVDKRRPEARK